MLGAYTSEKESRQGSFQWRLKLLVPFNGHRNTSVCTCDASWDTEYNRREHVSSSVVHTALYIAVLCIMPIVCAKKKKKETIVAQQILNQMLILLFFCKKLGKSITSFNASATAMTKHNYWKWICICKYKNECMLVNNLRIKDLNINNVLLCLDN